MTDEHLEAVDAFATIDADEAEGVRIPGTVPWLPAPEGVDPPDLGADTDSVLHDIRSSPGE